MTILSANEFNEQSSSGANSLERVYQQKVLASGPVFSLANQEAANQYCHKFAQTNNGATCLVVQEKSFLRIWSEISTEKPKKSSSSLLNKHRVSSESLVVDDDFVNYCQKSLAECIGPVASIVCQKVLAKNKNITRKKLVEKLAKKISDPQESERFKVHALKFK